MNRAQIIIFGVIAAVILLAVLVIFGVIPGLRPSTPAKITLNVWGFESRDLWQEIARRYHAQFPWVTIAYTEKDPATYENDLLNALAAGAGPDIFVLDNAEIQKHGAKLFPLPQNALSFHANDFRNTFFDAASQDLITKDGNILGVPLAVDTLALFYNRDFFNSANIPNPPVTWDDFASDVKQLTTYSEVGTVVRSGAALGTVANVAHAVDLLSGLFLQSGIHIIDRATGMSDLSNGRASGVESPAESALAFYTSFADTTRRTYAWSDFFPNSLDAFAEGKTAIVFGFARDMPLIIEKNPHLNFGIAAFPQAADASKKTYYADYDAEAVSRQSAHPLDAWNVLLWLSTGENDKMFADAVALAPGRRDLVAGAPPADYLRVFYGQALASKTWPIPDVDAVAQIFSEMITSVVSHQSNVSDAVGRASSRLDTFAPPPSSQ